MDAAPASGTDNQNEIKCVLTDAHVLVKKEWAHGSLLGLPSVHSIHVLRSKQHVDCSLSAILIWHRLSSEEEKSGIYSKQTVQRQKFWNRALSKTEA